MSPTIVRLSVQALLGRRRFWWLLVVPAVLVGLAVVVRLLAGTGVGYDEIVAGVGLTLALPLVSLLATSSVLGPEIDDGSVVYLLAKPVSRYVVAVSKYAVALVATWVFAALPLLLTGLVLEPADPGRSWAWAGGGAAAAAAYTALFLAVSAVTRHAVVLGLLFVFLWEGLLGTLLAGVKWVSIAAWGRSLAADWYPAPGQAGLTGTAYAVTATLALVAAGCWFTGERLRSFALRGET